MRVSMICDYSSCSIFEAERTVQDRIGRDRTGFISYERSRNGPVGVVPAKCATPFAANWRFGEICAICGAKEAKKTAKRKASH